MTWLHTQAITLKSEWIKDNERLLTLLTHHRGVVRAFIKLSHKESISALCKIEVLLLKSNSGVWRVREWAVMDTFISLRDSLEGLLEAEIMVSKIRACPGLEMHGQEHSASLFSYFEKALLLLPVAQFPKAIGTAFILQLLKQEGFFTSHVLCNLCQQPLMQGSFRLAGEMFCKKDAPQRALFFSCEDEKKLSLLQMDNWQELVHVTFERDFFSKTEKLLHPFFE